MSANVVLERSARPSLGGIVDCDIHPTLRDRDALNPYLSKRWRDHLSEYGELLYGPYAGAGAYPRYAPAISRRDAWPPDGGLPGSNVDFMRKQHLDPNKVVLGVLEPLGKGHSTRNLDLGNALCAALNEWQAAEFVAPEPRLRASVLIAQDDAVASVAEIEKRALDASFVQVQMPAMTTEPLGHRRYRPILEAAAHHGFPIGIHIGGPIGSRTASGWPSYFNEEHLDMTFAGQTQVMSLVLEGVFELLPSLKVIIIECGCAWTIGLEHRLDRLWQRMRSEVPYLKHPPSHYLREHIYFSTQPVEEPDKRKDLGYIFDQIGWHRLVYASDYPHWDFDDPRYAFQAAVPEEKKELLFRENAKRLFRLL